MNRQRFEKLLAHYRASNQEGEARKLERQYQAWCEPWINPPEWGDRYVSRGDARVYLPMGYDASTSRSKLESLQALRYRRLGG